LIDWQLKPTLAVIQLYRGDNWNIRQIQPYK